MKTNELGLAIIKSCEGCRLKAYRLIGEKYYTIGYGHSYDSAITKDTVWTQEEAEKALKKDLQKYENYVENYLKRYGFKFNSNQFSALVSYCYNRGPGGLDELLRNSKCINDVGKNIVKYWGSAILYKKGLVARRKREKTLFNQTEAPASQKTSNNKKYIAVTVTSENGVNFRISAGKDGAKICAIPHGATVYLITANVAEKDGYKWSKVKYNGETGYVITSSLKF